ncbi:MAG: hypothetical protein JST49_08740 [Bacteroidetes bacterium]|nr:hypothetical protein [Bacteroidota bacterium]
MADYLFNYLHTYTWWQGVLSLLKYGYVPMVLLLLVLYISKPRRTLAIQLLELVNWIMLSISLLITVNLISSIVNIIFFTSDEIRFRLYNRFFGPYGYATIWLITAQSAPLLFFFRKLRTTFWLPTALIIFGYPDDVVVFVTNLFDVYYGDYTIEYFVNFALKYTLGFLLYGIVLAVVYWGRGKLASGNLVKQ